MDSYWLLIFFILHQLDKIVLKVIPTVLFLCAITVMLVWTFLRFFNIENNFSELRISLS